MCIIDVSCSRICLNDETLLWYYCVVFTQFLIFYLEDAELLQAPVEAWVHQEGCCVWQMCPKNKENRHNAGDWGVAWKETAKQEDVEANMKTCHTEQISKFLETRDSFPSPQNQSAVLFTSPQLKYVLLLWPSAIPEAIIKVSACHGCWSSTPLWHKSESSRKVCVCGPWYQALNTNACVSKCHTFHFTKKL